MIHSKKDFDNVLGAVRMKFGAFYKGKNIKFFVRYTPHYGEKAAHRNLCHRRAGTHGL